jgi:magnesium transporter
MTDHAELEALTNGDLVDLWPALSREERAARFGELPRRRAEELFLSLPAPDQAELLELVPTGEQRSWVRLLHPDDAADLVQAAGDERREPIVALLDQRTALEVRALLAYAEDEAGGLMSPRFARVRPDMTAAEALSYLRRQTREQSETVYYVYVLDETQRLLGVVSFRELFTSPPERLVREVMRTDVVSVGEEQDQESVARVFREHGLLALPVVDAERRLVGIITVDDIVDVVQEVATEDFQKLGGMEALAAPYLRSGFGQMVRKRAGWLAALFLGEMLTTAAMARYEQEIARAVVLALFVPLIISSGGNSGAQASTLVIRAMALGELRPRDWWRVGRRELATGAVLGALLGTIGFLRIELWHAVRPAYGEHHLSLALTVALSLVGVVALGSLAGSLLPFLLRSLGIDPASASGPFVATLVDVTGVVIYFSIAILLLSGSVL